MELRANSEKILNLCGNDWTQIPQRFSRRKELFVNFIAAAIRIMLAQK